MLWVVGILLMLVCVLCYLYTCFPEPPKSRKTPNGDISFHHKNLTAVSKLISAKNAYLLTPNLCYLLESKQLSSLEYLAKQNALAPEQLSKLARLRPRVQSFKIESQVTPISENELSNMQMVTNKELLVNIELLKKLIFSDEAKRYLSAAIVQMEGARLVELNLRIGVSAILKDVELFVSQRQFETVERILAQAKSFVLDEKIGGELEAKMLAQVEDCNQQTTVKIAKIKQSDYQDVEEQPTVIMMPTDGEGLDDWEEVLGVRKKHIDYGTSK